MIACRAHVQAALVKYEAATVRVNILLESLRYLRSTLVLKVVSLRAGDKRHKHLASGNRRITLGRSRDSASKLESCSVLRL